MEIATGKGEIQIGSMTLTVYQMESGKRIIPKDEFERFMEAVTDGELTEDALKELHEKLGGGDE